MVKRKGIQDLINKILGKGPIWFFLSMNTFHFQWEDLYILKLNWQIRLQVVIEKTGLQIAHSTRLEVKVLIFEVLLVSDCHKSNLGWLELGITIFLLEGGYFGVQEEAVN